MKAFVLLIEWEDVDMRALLAPDKSGGIALAMAECVEMGLSEMEQNKAEKALTADGAVDFGFWKMAILETE